MVQCPRQLPLVENGAARHLQFLLRIPCCCERWTLSLCGQDREPFASETTCRSLQKFQEAAALVGEWPLHFQMHLASNGVTDRKCLTRCGESGGAYPQAFFQPRIPSAGRKRGPTL